MDTPTVNRMNLLMQKNAERINAMISSELKELMVKAEKDLNLNESQFLKLCVVEKLERMYGE